MWRESEGECGRRVMESVEGVWKESGRSVEGECGRSEDGECGRRVRMESVEGECRGRVWRESEGDRGRVWRESDGECGGRVWGAFVTQQFYYL